MPVTSDRARRKSTIIRLSLAGLAVLGIGAALTTAAWTDNAWFSAQADAATVDLKAAVAVGGSCDPAVVNYVDADTSDVAVAIPAATFANLVPNEDRTVEICLQNASTVELTVSAPTITTAGALFGGNTPPELTAPVSTPELAANATVTVEVTVETDADWPSSYQQLSGTATILFTGKTTL